jgi:hypothetical protein
MLERALKAEVETIDWCGEQAEVGREFGLATELDIIADETNHRDELRQCWRWP